MSSGGRPSIGHAVPEQHHDPGGVLVSDDQHYEVIVIGPGAGSWGPKEADALLPSGDTWHDPAG